MKGISVVLLLAIAVALAGGAAALAFRKERPAERGSPLEEAKVAYANRQFRRAEELLAGRDSFDAVLLRAKIVSVPRTQVFVPEE